MSLTFLFRCVLLTVVGGVSSFAYASLDDGIAHYNYNRTSVRYALITYCFAASSERNSGYQFCCSNGNRDSNTNATMKQQQYVTENTTVAADISSRICHGLAPAAPAIGGVLLYVLPNNSQSSRRHTAMYRYSNSDPEVAAIAGVAALQ